LLEHSSTESREVDATDEERGHTLRMKLYFRTGSGSSSYSRADVERVLDRIRNSEGAKVVTRKRDADFIVAPEATRGDKVPTVTVGDALRLVCEHDVAFHLQCIKARRQRRKAAAEYLSEEDAEKVNDVTQVYPTERDMQRVTDVRPVRGVRGAQRLKKGRQPPSLDPSFTKYQPAEFSAPRVPPVDSGPRQTEPREEEKEGEEEDKRGVIGDPVPSAPSVAPSVAGSESPGAPVELLTYADTGIERRQDRATAAAIEEKALDEQAQALAEKEPTAPTEEDEDKEKGTKENKGLFQAMVDMVPIVG
jgi:hypothetical protein